MVFIYFDTSALAKLILEEPESTAIEANFKQADMNFTHPVARLELESAIARRHREPRGLSAQATEDARRGVADLLTRMAQTPLDSAVLDRAVALVRRHPLRTYDAMHLAAAQWVRRAARLNTLHFACFDKRLRKAADTERLKLIPEFMGSA